MSTPQTATALHHHHFYPPTHQYPDYSLPSSTDYRPNGTTHNGPYNSNSVANNDSPNLRHASTATYATKQPSTNASITYSAKNSPEMPPPANRRRRPPNWDNYFQNGVPKEIITISDTPEPETRAAKHATTYADAQPTVAGASSHADKRRRVDATAHKEPTYQPSNGVNRRRPWEDDSELSNSADSRGRSAATNSYSTGQTSLSAGSGTQQRARIDNTQIGQKRKRPARDRSSEGSSEVEVVSKTTAQDQWGPYIPPARPPIKAKEIYVKPIHEVSYRRRLWSIAFADIDTSDTMHQNVMMRTAITLSILELS